MERERQANTVRQTGIPADSKQIDRERDMRTASADVNEEASWLLCEFLLLLSATSPLFVVFFFTTLFCSGLTCLSDEDDEFSWV